MGPVVRIVVALFLTSVFQMAPARATGERGMFATASHAGGMIQLSQSGRTDKDRWQEEEERRVKKRRSERRAEREKLERDRARRWSKERRLRMERAAREHLERQRKQREARSRSMEEGYETRQQNRRRARRARRLNADRSALLKRFPPAWVVGIIEGRVEKGWTADAVRESWGRPRRVLKVLPSDEVWVYPRKRVIFTGGAVRQVVVEQPATGAGR